ncbi:MAG: hypothetical protein QM753_03305 [Thermomicrobiales bacterium]
MQLPAQGAYGRPELFTQPLEPSGQPRDEGGRCLREMFAFRAVLVA